MKKYIFLTAEGTTVSPNGQEVRNKQVIGIVENAGDENAALKKLLQENSWIFDAAFNVGEFEIYEVL